jgi:hypothetical protein
MIYDVNLIPQTSRMSCWAASIGMILGWRDRMTYDDSMIARNPGGLNYMTSYTHGLSPNDQYILRANGFTIEPGQSFASPHPIMRLLNQYGPLWVATWAPGPHIRVVRGIRGDTVWINDPAPVGRGSQYTRHYRQFFGRMETLAHRELNQPNPVYIAHL